MATRYASRRTRVFHWVPRDVTPSNDIKIDSVSVKIKIWNAEFTRSISPEIGFFKIILDNNNEEFSGKYSGDETVEFYIDYANGTIRRFLGTVDTIKSKYDTSKGFTLELAGNHVSGELLNITVTASYSGNTTCDAILKELVDEYLSGYTYTNTETSIVKPTINWNNKPFWECVEDLCKLAKSGTRFDCFVNDSKDFNFFEENSKDVANTEAIVWNDTMISTEGLGTQTLTQKNKIIVYGESGDKQMIVNTTGTGTKEEVVFDSKITTIDMASELGSAEFVLKNRTPIEGKANCFILAGIIPGYRIWITNPNFKIHGQYKIYKYTHKFPNERTEVFVQTSREIPHIFKKRIENELALQTVTNPFKMLNTLISLTFDSDEVTIKDPNVKIEDGIIKLSSGSEGTFTKTIIFSSSITSIHLQVKGSALVGTKYEFSTDGGSTTQFITPETEITVPSGTSIWLKVYLNSASTEIDSLAVHGK